MKQQHKEKRALFQNELSNMGSNKLLSWWKLVWDQSHMMGLFVRCLITLKVQSFLTGCKIQPLRAIKNSGTSCFEGFGVWNISFSLWKICDQKIYSNNFYSECKKMLPDMLFTSGFFWMLKVECCCWMLIFWSLYLIIIFKFVSEPMFYAWWLNILW